MHTLIDKHALTKATPTLSLHTQTCGGEAVRGWPLGSALAFGRRVQVDNVVGSLCGRGKFAQVSVHAACGRS